MSHGTPAAINRREPKGNAMPSTRGSSERRREGDSTTVASRIAELLRDDIIGGQLSAGERINEVALAKRYGVSRIPLREALRIAEGQGLVEIRPFSGAFVSELSVEDAVDLWEMYETLETLALRLALPQLTNEELRLAERIARNVEREPDPRRRFELAGELYAVLYGGIGRPRLLSLLQTLAGGATRYLYAYHAAERMQRPKLAGPRIFIAELRKGDVDAAVRYLRDFRRAQLDVLIQHLTGLQERSAEKSATRARTASRRTRK
jgi:DNA-binding GntR family transcriptional regulator